MTVSETSAKADLPEPGSWSQAEPGGPGFRNEVVPLQDLPDYRQVDLSPVSARFAPYALISASLFWALLTAASLLGPRLPFVTINLPVWLPAGPLLGLIWFGSIAWLDARRRAWALREHDLIYRSGLIWRRTAILPFARIQHVETASGPLERAFGLMRVKCFTAGGMAADLTVAGLEHEAARKVRQHLLEQIREDGAEAPEDDGV